MLLLDVLACATIAHGRAEIARKPGNCTQFAHARDRQLAEIRGFGFGLSPCHGLKIRRLKGSTGSIPVEGTSYLVVFPPDSRRPPPRPWANV
jgi:hypothetical protein